MIPIDHETFAACLALVTEMEDVCAQMGVPEHRWTRVREDLQSAQQRSVVNVFDSETPALCRRQAH
jgi:hypothetical protein